MKKQSIFKACIIILFVLLILVVGQINTERVWAGAEYQTVPTAATPGEEPTVEPPGPDDEPWWRENLGLICGSFFILLLGVGLIAGLISWWVRRGSKTLGAGKDSSEDDWD